MSSVDVIVPCYRYAHFLREAVTSVLSQRGPAVRVLILDDTSPDDTPDVAAALMSEDSRVSYVRHVTNQGHIRTYNEGIEWVSANYYLLLSADDYILPGALKRAVDLLDQNPDMGFAFGNALELNEHGATKPVRPLEQDRVSTSLAMSGPEFIRKSGAWNMVPTPTAVIRTSLQKQCGGYNVDLPHSGDMEMWLRLAARGSVGFVSAEQAVYRRHSANMSTAYAVDSWLPDVSQRRLAIERFYSESGHLLADAPTLRASTLYALARETVGYAGGAFDSGASALSMRLADYAVETSPQVKRSRQWYQLRAKRLLGPRLWALLRRRDRTVIGQTN